MAVFVVTVVSLSSVQWAAMQFLATYCSQWSWMGPVVNLFSLGSPICHFVNRFQLSLADHYVTVWGGALAVVPWVVARRRR